jgi:hypothetical protein
MEKTDLFNIEKISRMWITISYIKYERVKNVGKPKLIAK